jgi:GNAT superfamily N-acetyltransferase
VCKKLSKALKKRWADDSQRTLLTAIVKERWDDEDFRNRIIEASKQNWENEEYRQRVVDALNAPETLRKISIAAKRNWNIPEYRDKVFEATKCVSSVQLRLYALLDDLGILYFRERVDDRDDQECRLGPYSFDCVVPRFGRPTLLIEVQGEYWHSLPHIVGRDKAKASYIENNFAGVYELKHIWEHEFNNLGKVQSLLSYWTGMGVEVIDYSLDDVIIERCVAADASDLYSKYHYLTSTGRGGISFAARLGDIVIAACTFSPLPRQNIKIDGYDTEQVRELSRFCIHPSYRRKNLATWFLSRCIKLLPVRYECIISYADTTFNHDGGMYRAANFVQDRTVPPDYWYVNVERWVMHKKTLYNRARSMRMTEAEYAEQHGYSKVYGSEKLRYRYDRL